MLVLIMLSILVIFIKFIKYLDFFNAKYKQENKNKNSLPRQKLILFKLCINFFTLKKNIRPILMITQGTYNLLHTKPSYLMISFMDYF